LQEDETEADGAVIDAADVDRVHLRHEFRAHAGTQMAVGYPLVLMLIVAIGPILYLKRKDWL
jgi:hypothetical protein